MSLTFSGGIANGDAYRTEIASVSVPAGHTVIKVISAVVAADNVGGVHELSVAAAVVGVLLSAVGNAGRISPAKSISNPK